MNIIINLTQSTYHQTLNIGKILEKIGAKSGEIGPKWYIFTKCPDFLGLKPKILRKSGQNRGKIRAKSGQIGPKPDFLGFKPKIQSKFGANWPFAPNSEHCPDFRDD